MIPGSFFFAVAGPQVFYCRALSDIGGGRMRAVCLNCDFESVLDREGRMALPHTGGRTARVELVMSADSVSAVRKHFEPRDHSAAIAYFLRRKQHGLGGFAR